MVRKFVSIIAALGMLVAACGDSGGDATGSVVGAAPTSTSESDDGTNCAELTGHDSGGDHHYRSCPDEPDRDGRRWRGCARDPARRSSE